ncbi:hypothetical protein OEZ83_26850, partial [Leclercia adecarboxylata]
ALLYPHLAYHLSYRFKRDHPERTSQTLLCLDALNAGAGILLLGFSIVPSLMFLLTLAFSALVSGSLRNLALAMACVAVGIGLAYLVAPLEYQGTTPPLVSLASILFTSFYVCATAYFVHQQGQRLAQA